MDTKKLFKQRRKDAWYTGLRYFRLIVGGGGTPLFLLIVIGLTAYGYSLLLKELPPHFSVELLLAFVTALILTPCSVRTFLKEPDSIFLLPSEHRMKHYFTASLLYSITIQVITTALLVSLLFPLYRVRIGDTSSFLWVVVAILLLKAWNVHSHWQALHYANRNRLHPYVRFVFNFGIAAMLFCQETAWWIWLLAFLILGLFTAIDRSLRDPAHVPWYLLVDQEERKLASYYSLVNLFIDVPQVQYRVRRRKILSWLADRVPFHNKHFLLFLYLRTFIRHNVYLGIYFRLLLVAVVLISTLQNIWLIAVVYLAALAANGIQLPAIALHHRRHIWIQLYPRSEQQKTASFSQLAFALLLIQSLLMLIPSFFHPQAFLLATILLLAGGVLSYALSYFYLPKQAEK